MHQRVAQVSPSAFSIIAALRNAHGSLPPVFEGMMLGFGKLSLPFCNYSFALPMQS